MEFTIVFCTDGVLRVKFSNKPMIPVSFIQKSKPYGSDFEFWTKWWDEYVIFEHGLTVGQFLSCLEPWSDFFKILTHKDIQAFIDESRQPILVKDNDEHPLTWVSLSYNTEVSPLLDYQSKDDNGDFSSWFNSPQKARLTGTWDISSSYKLTGYSEGYIEQYSVDHCPINQLTNLPLVLAPDMFVTFEDFMAKKILGENYEIFSSNSYGIKQLKQEKHVVHYIEGEHYHRFRAVIEGFFWWFPTTPTSRDIFNDSLKKTIAQLDKTEPVPEKVSDNVVNLFGDNTSIDSVKTEQDATLKDDKLTVQAAPGAFDSIIEQYESDSIFWEKMLEKVKGSNDVIVKIGEVKPALPIEKRIYGFIADDKTIPSDFKDI